MVMSVSVLATELENLTPSSSEVTAAAALTAAYGVFAADAVGNGIPIEASGITLGEAAMEPALSGMSASGAGAVIMANAIIAFWIAAAIPTSFPTSIAVTPPPNAGLAVALPPVFASNTSGNLSLADAALAIATAMHAQAIIGGTVTLPGPVVGPIL